MKLWHYLENWFQAEYIFSKFPNYLLSKVKSLNLTHEQKNKILEAVRPKEIGFKSENQEIINSIKKNHPKLENKRFENKLKDIAIKKKQ